MTGARRSEVLVRRKKDLLHKVWVPDEGIQCEGSHTNGDGGVVHKVLHALDHLEVVCDWNAMFRFRPHHDHVYRNLERQLDHEPVC